MMETNGGIPKNVSIVIEELNKYPKEYYEKYLYEGSLCIYTKGGLINSDGDYGMYGNIDIGDTELFCRYDTTYVDLPSDYFMDIILYSINNNTRYSTGVQARYSAENGYATTCRP